MRRGLEGALAHGATGLGECVYLLRAAPGAANVRSAFLNLVVGGGVEIGGSRLRAGDLVALDAPPVSLAADVRAGAACWLWRTSRP